MSNSNVQVLYQMKLIYFHMPVFSLCLCVCEGGVGGGVLINFKKEKKSVSGGEGFRGQNNRFAAKRKTSRLVTPAGVQSYLRGT